MLVLGIETSCDETAAAVIRDGREIVSSVIASQIKTHERFGGVVPELASRHHLERIDLVIDSALKKAGVLLKDLDAVAVTSGPGLVGSLLVGLQAAKSIAWGPGPRASQALMLAVRARALLDGRYAPSVDDVLELAEPILKHRMALTFAARADGETIPGVIGKLKSRIG